MGNPFDEAQGWVPTMTLPPGQHRVKIASAISTQTKGYTPKPMVTVELVNDDGNLKDYIVLAVPNANVRGSSIGIQKIAALFDAAGAYRPTEQEFDPDTMAIAQSALNRLAQRSVIVVSRMEMGKTKDADGNEIDKEFNRVQGYLPANGPGVNTRSAPSSAPVMGAAPVADDDDIPF